MPTQCRTPVGRIVWGNPATPTKKTDQQNKPIMDKKTGEQVQEWICGVAFPKAQFEQSIWPYMAAEKATLFGDATPQRFAWKYKDGDNDKDQNGNPLSNKEGYAGCFVLTISTRFPIPIYKLNAQGSGYDVVPPEGIKTGDYVSVPINFEAHNEQTPGLYVNPQCFELVGYGQPIYSGPDAMTLLGGQRHQLPQGASATPVQSSSAPGMPGMAAPATAQGSMGNGMPPAATNSGSQPVQSMGAGASTMAPGQSAQTPASPATAFPSNGMPQPAHDFIPNAMGQQQPQQPTQMPGQPAGGMPGNR